MSEVATIPESNIIDHRPKDQWPEPPRLLVEWSSPWKEFQSALRPALARSPRRLAGEAPTGMFPYRGMLVCWLLECLLLIAVIVLPEHFATLEVETPLTRPQWDVIYYSGDELPQTQDRGGAQSGKSGRAGGQQAHHRTQTIRVARGDKPSEKVADAPKINLPHSDSAGAILLASKPNPGPPPAEGLRSSLIAPRLPAMSAVPPSPELNSSASRSSSTLTTNVIPQRSNCPPRAECLARQNADRQPACADCRRTGSTRRAARFGRFPRPADTKRRRGCAAGLCAAAGRLVHAQTDAAGSRCRGAAVAGQPRSQ